MLAIFSGILCLLAGATAARAESVTEVVLPGPTRKPGLKLVTLTTGPHAPDTIIEASLVVLCSDWHAVAQSLKVQGVNEIREYELGELAYEVLPPQALTVFADIAPAASSSASPTRIPASPSPSIKALPTEADLREAGVAALYALYQSGAVERLLVALDPGKQQLRDFM